MTMTSASRDSFTFFFLILMPFISLSCLIAKAKMLSTILHRLMIVVVLALFLTSGERIKYFTINYYVIHKFFNKCPVTD